MSFKINKNIITLDCGSKVSCYYSSEGTPDYFSFATYSPSKENESRDVITRKINKLIEELRRHFKLN